MQEQIEGAYELARLSLAELTKAAQAEFRELFAQLPNVETSTIVNQVIVSDELLTKIGDFTAKLQRAYDTHKESTQTNAGENLTILIRLGDSLSARLFNLSKNDDTLLVRAAGIPEMRP